MFRRQRGERDSGERPEPTTPLPKRVPDHEEPDPRAKVPLAAESLSAPPGTPCVDAPTPAPDPAPDLVWLTLDETSVGVQSPPTTPAHPATPPTADPPTANPPPISAKSQAATEIDDLLVAAHDTALRLRAQAEASVRSTIEAAKSEIAEQTRNQRRELAAAKADAERHHAEIIHQAEIGAIATVHQAERDAASIRAAAEALHAQGRAEVEAMRGLLRRKLAEIEAVRSQTLDQSREMLALGQGMLSTVVEFDRGCDARLAHSRNLVEQALRAAVT